MSVSFTCNAGLCRCLVAIVVLSAVGLHALADDAVDFKSQVAPILAEHCLDCHSGDEPDGELRLDSLIGINAGGASGLVIAPGVADESLLAAAIRYQDESLRMPPEQQLSAEELTAVITWIDQGAIHPDGSINSMPQTPPFDIDVARQFWALQPLAGDSGSSVDDLVAVELQRAGINASPPAPKRILIRRATLDLTGLPPTPAEVTAYLNDESPDAFATVIDRLLASTAYGERWGRHWLDVVRYADSNGLDENVAHGNAWRYRDYVISSFNDDKPFDQFIREQLAGDLMIDADTPEAIRNQYLTATGFLSLGPKVLAEGDETKLRMDIVDEQIDTVGKAFLGLTLGCARCHDHKFDPISQADYYSLAGIFDSTQTMESLKRIAKWNEHALVTQEYVTKVEAFKQRIADQEDVIEKLIAAASVEKCPPSQAADEKIDEQQLPAEIRERLKTLREELKTAKADAPISDSAMGVADGKIHNSRIHFRGSHLTLGPVVSRGFPVVLRFVSVPPIADGQSGRLQLAEWLTRPDHPLTARVLANRLWRWHFGTGLVSTTDNFGFRGEKPVNQPLLDWLAQELIRSDWSIKSMHRIIMLSQVYQRSSGDSEAALSKDPGNRLLWRYPQRRLEAEAIRDSILAVSGTLDRSMGGSMLHVANREFIFNHTSKDGTSYASNRRSVYLPVIRNNLYDEFSLFDYTNASVANGNRSMSTVASQSLFLMNSELITMASAALANVILNSVAKDDAERVQLLFERCVSRPATPAEVTDYLVALMDFENALGSIEGADGDTRHAAWTVLCQTMLMSSEFLYLP
jgi:cytochrome c553